jgi:tetratricopeptide (TPR) repeat protein
MLLPSACSHPQVTAGEENHTSETEVLIIGTFHGLHFGMTNYHPDTLRYLLTLSKPDVLAVEIREKDMKEPGFGKAPSDITKIVIPWAKKKNISVRPVDWWEDESREKHNALMVELKKTDDGKKKLSQLQNEMAVHKDRYKFPDEMTVEYIHSKEFTDKDRAVRVNHTKVLGEGPGNLFWNTRADKMYELLQKVIVEYPGKRIVVVTGAAHRKDFEDRIQQKGGVKLLSLNSLPGIKDLPPYTGKEGEPGEMKMVLMSRVQGPKANNAPDHIDVKQVNQLISDARKLLEKQKVQQQTWLDYAEAEAAYLAKDYKKALELFHKVSEHATDADKVFYLPMKNAAQFRKANMLDLLQRRDEALKIYKDLGKDKMIAGLAGRFIEKPFQRPGK